MRFLLFSLPLLITSCFFGDCFMASGSFGNFEITSDVPNFNLALGDSVIIDMSDYWRGDIGCNEEIYIPQVLYTESASNFYELRTVGKYLIVKGISSGVSKIYVYAETRSSSDSCSGLQIGISQPIEFEVQVGVSTDINFEKEIEGNIGNWLIDITVEPQNFNIGDTVMVTTVAQDTSIISQSGHWKYQFKWFINNSIILTDRFIDDCDKGFHEFTNNSVSIIVADTSKKINGLVHIQNSNGTELRNGLAFNINSRQ